MVSDALDTIIKALVPGNPIKNAYIAGRDFIKGKDASLGGKLFTNFGFGIGNGIKEDQLLINETNENLVQAGMIFHVKLTLQDIHKKPTRSVIAIGDSVLIK